MTSIASVVQYPLPCPKCKSYTSQSIETLLKNRSSSCRICSSAIRLTDQQLQSLDKTLSHMSDCGFRKEVNVQTNEESSIDTV